MPPPSASVAGTDARYGSNCTVSRLKAGVEMFARLFAITSIERWDAICCDRPTRNPFSTRFAPFWSPCIRRLKCTAHARGEPARFAGLSRVAGYARQASPGRALGRVGKFFPVTKPVLNHQSLTSTSKFQLFLRGGMATKPKPVDPPEGEDEGEAKETAPKKGSLVGRILGL